VKNPFLYSKPATSEELIDREDEVAQILSLLWGGHNCRLSAPRRYGKTTLVNRIRDEAAREGTPSVYVNFYGILSLEEAAARLERGYRDLQGAISRWMAGKLEGLRLSLGTPIGSVEIDTRSPRDPARLLHELLEMPRQIFAKTGEPIFVCFDEFQEVLATRVPIDGLIRSIIEQHAEEASYLFAGSHPGMMRALFEDRERPFYGQARSVTLDPLAPEHLAEYVSSRFERSERDVGSALRPLLAVSGGHPQRAMMLAHFLWDLTGPRGVADERTFAQALEIVMEELSEAFDRTWRGLDDGERRALAALVLSRGRPTGSAGLHAADAPRSTVLDALARLRDTGLLFSVDGRFEPVDPLLSHWIERGRLQG
jgi:uncharacterized protein